MTAVVVPGHHGRERLADLVRAAERVAEETPVDVVVFTGWARRGGLTEAEQMHADWRGPEVELVLEPTARTTVENATRTLPLLLERGIDRAVIVCSAPHLVRARLFFASLYRRHGVEPRFHAVRTPPTLRAIGWELAALPLLPWQLRAAQVELRRGGR